MLPEIDKYPASARINPQGLKLWIEKVDQTSAWGDLKGDRRQTKDEVGS